MTRNLIDIPNHPDLPTVSRKVRVVQSVNNYKHNCIDLSLEVIHYVDDKEVKYFPYEVMLSGDNDVFVNPANGDFVIRNEEGEYPNGSIGEYDHLSYIVNTAKAYTQIELEEIYVIKRVDVINKKLYS